MTRRQIPALVGVAMFAVLTGTPVDARQTKKQKTLSQTTFDQHAVSYGPHVRDRRYPRPTTITKRSAKVKGEQRTASVSRDCLHHSTKDVLAKLEARFGKVQLVSTCRPGARMPSGDVSMHARNRAVDFKVPRGVDKRDVMVWLGRNSPGVTMSYRSMDHVHTDTGSFHKVIYNAANHEAGERAVAIWQERERQSAMIALPLPRPEIVTAPIVVASLGEDPVFEEYAVQPSPLRPEPITTWGDRRGIFQRYFESREIIAKPWVTTSCPNGKELPKGLQALLKDSADHYRRTVYINSAYRSAAYNRRIRGAARNSQHIQCRAVDFRVAGVSSVDLRRYVMANLNRWGITGLGYYGPSGHLHADVRAKTTKLVTWTGGSKRFAKRRHARYAAAG